VTAYAVRQGAFRKETTWSLTEGALVESQAGRGERVWPFSALRQIRIAPGANRYVPGEVVMRMVFYRRRAIDIGSHSFRGVARYEDRSRVFAAWVRSVCAEAARTAPGARFEAGAAWTGGVFLGAAVLLGIGVAALLAVSLSTGANLLGLDLAARLSFGLLLMIAIQPWLSAAGSRRFDPLAIPADVLAGRRS
jgi:hypothetical protein